MSQKNETLPLLLALIITGGLIAFGGWWLSEKGKQPPVIAPKSNPSPEPIPNNTGQEAQTFAEIQNIPTGLFNYGGSTTWAPIRDKVDQAIQIVHPRFQLRYTQPIADAPGSGTGIKMLISDQLAFSQSSRPLKDEEYNKAKDRGFTLQQIPVAIDGIAFAVHPSLNISGLTLNQIKDIYTGKITNWNQVGGENLPIIPCSRSLEAGGTVEFFVENVLGKENFSSDVKIISTTTEALRFVGNNRGALYYASAPEVVPQCTVKTIPIGKTSDQMVTPYQQPFVPLSQCPNSRNQLNKTAFQNGDYPITRRLFVIVKNNGQIDETAGLIYTKLLLTDQGQKLIAEAGFISLSGE
jgi:phosphate transport system substrate-binding protein